MPLYEYQCDACGNRFEKIRKFSDPPVDVCPSCGGSVKKLVSSPAFQFKGTGWYVTDYAKPSGGAGGKDAKDSQEGSSGKAEGGGSTEKSDKAEKSGKAEKASETKKTDKPSEAKPKD
jgi:putative FmdB family regulatory protein